MKKINILKELLESQEPIENDNWDKLHFTIINLKGDDGLNLVEDNLQVGFSFDPTGDKFYGMFNFKA